MLTHLATLFYKCKIILECRILCYILEKWMTPTALKNDVAHIKGHFKLCSNLERPSVWTNKNAEMSKVRPLGLHDKD